MKGLSLLSVGNGHWQVAFHKLPLYRFEGDKKKGQAHGQNVGGVWFAVLKSGIPAAATAGAPAATLDHDAPGASTTQPVTSTTQAAHSNASTGATPTTRRRPADIDAGDAATDTGYLGAGADDTDHDPADHDAADVPAAHDHSDDQRRWRRVWLLGARGSARR